ncbi:hypothetical protein [Metabacillus elymi]|uniref:Uncharacterized protein n=1 Tax=Metabacillus elymi TaxID=2745198 RepID=A0ABX6S2C3_9BACI|nr:hypothetical protein [Metabacillus sp. KUDC1714]QNF27967.1 hypothetical protein HUW50_11070 [Metabacillus sp. KUDC1714]
MKKFLFGFGGFLILLGAAGIINHISMAIKAVQEEQEIYGGSIPFMILQMTGSTIGPYISCIIGGGMIIAITLFLNEYQKRSELTSQLIQALTEQRSIQSEKKTDNHNSTREDYKDTNTKVISTTKTDVELSVDQDDERYFWKG